jgi:pimeloyl-ACP methyl ester carboxylesterase
MTPADPLALETVGAGPPVLFLHGAGGTPRANFPFLDEVAQRYTVLAPDLPGVGGSGLGPTPLTVPGVADRILATMDAAGVDRLAVCGYSMGTLLASWLAAVAPDRVEALVLTAGLARAAWSCQDTMERWARLLGGDPHRLGQFVVDRIYRPETGHNRGAAWLEATVREVGTGFPPGTRAHIEMVSQADVRAAVAMTRQPLLLLVPTQDAFVTPDHSAEIRRLRPDAQVAYVDAGHAVGDEQPAAWLEALAGFLDHHLTPSPT